MSVNENQGEMSFLDHLEELRWRIIKAFASVAIFAVPCGIFWRDIFDLAMIHPLRDANPRPRIIFTSPAEAIVLSIKIAIAGGIIAASPFIFYQFWKFIAPGLYKKEKVIILPTVVVSTLCFILGIGFSYYILPYVLKFLAGYGAGVLEPYFKSNEYIGFILKITLAFGAVFELPVLSFVLTKIGMMTPKFLIKNTRYAIVVMFILSAILTPPDVISQAFLVVPLLVLYGISIGVSFLAQGKKST
ncbi:MAG: twin-arginine translocase subunit TatC [Chitinivibrionales bacterium]|nr:twin-arginine translocase subunit TatC [Chitinivibrionales bacterium]